MANNEEIILNVDLGNPYYVGARAYVTQTDNGAVVTVIDKDGTTVATIQNGADGATGETGATGADGNGIASIEKTSTIGLVDTYTITFTDGTTSTFEVTNGEANVQSDWSEDDSTSDSYILNKPAIPSKTSDLTNDSGFISDVTVDGTSVVADGVAAITPFGHSSASEAGEAGLVPAPAAGTSKLDVLTARGFSKLSLDTNYLNGHLYTRLKSGSSLFLVNETMLPVATTESDGVMSSSDKSKLNGIASYAQVNVQSDWNEADSTSDAYIANKPPEIYIAEYNVTAYADVCDAYDDGKIIFLVSGYLTLPLFNVGILNDNYIFNFYKFGDSDTIKRYLLSANGWSSGDTLTFAKASDIPNTEDILPTDTASGAIASFPDGTNLFPAKSVTADIEPIQSLNGYDKPWSGGAGKNKANLADGARTGQGITGTVSNQVISASGTATATYANINYFNAISITSGQTYTVRLSKAVSNAITFRFATDNTDTTYQQVNIASGSTSATFTANNNFTVFRLYISGLTSGNTVNISGLQVLVGEGNISAFEPYSNICPISGYDSVVVTVADDHDSPTVSNTYLIDLNGTRYGGTLDVVSGVLTVTDGNIASYNGETLPSTWISDRDVYASGTTPTIGAQVVYKLATPQTVQLTAQEVELLVGLNQVWANSGDVEVEYKADIQRYIEKKLGA